MPAVVTIGGERRDGFVRNVSIGGVFIAIDAPPEPATRIRVEISIGDHPLDAAADVAHRQAAGTAGGAVRESGMGVAFRGLADAERTLIAAFVGDRVRSFQL
jgi:hypothetical protein